MSVSNVIEKKSQKSYSPTSPSKIVNKSCCMNIFGSFEAFKKFQFLTQRKTAKKKVLSIIEKFGLAPKKQKRLFQFDACKTHLDGKFMSPLTKEKKFRYKGEVMKSL